MEQYIYFNSRDTFFRIEKSRIAYFEADKNYTNLWLTNGQKLVFSFGLGTMKEYLVKNIKVDVHHFVRIGKSLIINVNYLFQINILKQQIHLYAKETDKLFTLPASRESLKAFKEMFVQKNNNKEEEV